MKMTKRQCIANILIGFGSILNIAPVFAPINVGSPQDDLANMRKDWKVVGGYLNKAIGTIKNEPSTNTASRNG